MKREIRFYICLVMGFALLAYGAIVPPPGEVHKSLIIAAGILFSIGALCVGIDIRGIIQDVIRLYETRKDLLKELANAPKTND